MPWNVREAEVELGDLWNLSTVGVQRQLSRNLRNLVSIHEHHQVDGIRL